MDFSNALIWNLLKWLNIQKNVLIKFIIDK